MVILQFARLNNQRVICQPWFSAITCWMKTSKPAGSTMVHESWAVEENMMYTLYLDAHAKAKEIQRKLKLCIYM